MPRMLRIGTANINDRITGFEKGIIFEVAKSYFGVILFKFTV
jgi:hypothetical protein